MRSFLKLLVAGVAVAALPALAQAQNYPTRPVKLIVPFPAGGPADIIARTVGQKMSELLGQPVVIDNRGGAGGMSGVDAVAKSQADGYTIGFASPGAVAILPNVQPNMPYSVTKDLQPISLVTRVPEILVVASNVKATNVQELIALAKAKPNALNFASTGSGSMPHLAAELFKLKAGIDVVHVPYRGAAPAITDLLGNQVQYMFADVPVLLPHIQAGTFKALGIGSAKRSPAAPDVKTMAEQGLPEVQADNWYGMIAPAGLPPAVLAKLNKAVNDAVNAPEVKKKLAEQGAETEGTTPEAFGAFLASETRKWGGVIKEAGLKLEP